MVELIDYNVYLTPIRDLPCLEDVIQKGYSTEEENHKTVTIMVREHPIIIPFAIDSLIRQGESNYHSFIQRHAILYGISQVDSIIKSIADKYRIRSDSGTIRELNNYLKSSSGLPFDSTTEKDMTAVYLPAWCKEWIHSNCRYINMPAGRLALYIMIVALNKSVILNQEVATKIKYESESFLKYLDEIVNK